jgi:hypothetical protein
MPCPSSERLRPSRIGSIVQIPNPMPARSGINVPWASYTVRPSTRQAAVDLLRSSVISHARSRVKSSSKSSYGDSGSAPEASWGFSFHWYWDSRSAK